MNKREEERSLLAGSCWPAISKGQLFGKTNIFTQKDKYYLTQRQIFLHAQTNILYVNYFWFVKTNIFVWEDKYSLWHILFFVKEQLFGRKVCAKTNQLAFMNKYLWFNILFLGSCWPATMKKKYFFCNNKRKWSNPIIGNPTKIISAESL